jgi:hypothetical protein
MEFSFSIVRSEEGRDFQDFHPENARDGMKPQREAFHYASFCSILLWDITGSGRGSPTVRAGFDAHLVKPVNDAVLGRLLATLSDSSQELRD